MTELHESAIADDSYASMGDARSHSQPYLASFFAWYFGAFILSTLLWNLSTLYVRADFLELPMIAVHFPLAAFLEPARWMGRNQATFFYAIAFWGAVIPMAFYVAPKRIGPLRTALGFNFACAAASVAYACVYNYFGFGQVA